MDKNNHPAYDKDGRLFREAIAVLTMAAEELTYDEVNRVTAIAKNFNGREVLRLASKERAKAFLADASAWVEAHPMFDHSPPIAAVAEYNANREGLTLYEHLVKK